MGSLGFQELLLIFAIALIVFGPRKLPEIGRTMGRAFGEFRRATFELKNSLESEVAAEDDTSLRAKPSSSSIPARENPPDES